MIVVTIVVLLAIISVVSTRAVTTVKQLTQLCNQIARGDLDYDMADAPKRYSTLVSNTPAYIYNESARKKLLRCM